MHLTAGLPGLILVLFYFKYTTFDFIVFGIPWVIVWTVWCDRCKIIYWFQSYFYVYCYYLKLKLHCINQELQALLDSSMQNESKETCELYQLFVKSIDRNTLYFFRDNYEIQRLLLWHKDVCCEIQASKNYWARYLTILFVIHILLINFLLYLVLLTSVPLYAMFLCISVSFGQALLLVVITYSASFVWNESMKTYKILSKSFFTLKPKIETKIQVSTNVSIENEIETLFKR